MGSRPSGLCLLVGAAAVPLYLVVPGDVWQSSMLFDLLGGAAVVAMAAGVWWNRPARLLPWVLLVVGQALFVAGDLVFGVYERLLDRSPFPSVADLLYLLGYVALATGLALLLRGRSPAHDWASVLDASIVTAGLGSIVWAALIAPYLSDPSLSRTEVLFSVAYPLGDVLLLGLLVRLVFSGGVRTMSLALLGLSLAFLLVADSIYGWLSLRNAYTSGNAVDLLWIASYALVAAAALHPSMAAATVRSPVAESRFTTARMALVTLGLLAVPAAAVVADASGRQIVVARFVVAEVVLIALCIARLSLVIRAYEQATRRGEVLRSLGTRLMGGADREQIHRAVVDASVAVLCDPKAQVVLAVGPAATLLVVADAGFGDGPATIAARTLSAGERRSLAAGKVLELPGPVRIYPLTANAVFLGVIAVSSPRSALPAVDDALLVLAGQASLALQSAALESTLRRKAYEDALTGLPNSDLFRDRLRQALARRNTRGLAVLFIDLDGFKSVNDNHGHAAGDAVLIEAARRISSTLRAGDTAARMGGDEFAVLVDELEDRREATALAGRLVEVLSRPFTIAAGDFSCPASIGVTFPKARQINPEQIIHQADMAMYHAKRSGKAQTSVYETGPEPVAA